MNFQEKMIAIQNELKAPKNLFNKFGKYNYRNAESILEAVKPLLAKYKLYLKLENEPTVIGDKFFLRCTATISDAANTDQNTPFYTCATSYVEMDFNHAGMSAEQRGGCGISYGYKYLLNGLFLLDDAKDPDSDEFHEQTSKGPKAEEKRKGKPISNEQVNDIVEMVSILDLDLSTVLASGGFNSIYDVPADMAQQLYGQLKAKALKEGKLR